MPAQVPNFGPFSAVYIGDAPPAVGVLSSLLETRTKGSHFKYTVPETFVPVLGKTVQSDLATLDFALTFYSFDDTVMKLAMGNPVQAGGINRDDPSQFAQYTLLLLSANELDTTSVLIPVCWTVKNLDQNREKNTVGEMRIEFRAQNRNRFVQLYRQDTYANLATILGARSPI